MSSFEERRERRRSKQQRKRQELLDRGLAAFEAKHADLETDLAAVGHDPYVNAKWIDTDQGTSGWQFTLICRKCGQRHRGWLPRRMRGLSSDKPCTGSGPTYEEWVHEGLARIDTPDEGSSYTTVEVRAATVSEARSSALERLGLPESEAEIEVVDEGNAGAFGLGTRPAVVWGRPKAP